MKSETSVRSKGGQLSEASSPPIRLKAIVLPANDFWSPVATRTSFGVGSALRVGAQVQSQPKVGQLHSSLAGEQQVVGLKIAVCDARSVQRLEREGDRGGVKAGIWFSERELALALTAFLAALLEVVGEGATGEPLEREAHARGGGVGVVKSHHKVGADRPECPHLVKCMCLSPLAHQPLTREELNGWQRQEKRGREVVSG